MDALARDPVTPVGSDFLAFGPEAWAALVLVRLPSARPRVRAWSEPVARPQNVGPDTIVLPLEEDLGVVVQAPPLPRLARWLPRFWSCLRPEGTLWLAVAPDLVHYVKILADALLGRRRFYAELIWTRPLVSRRHDTWPIGHWVLLGYASNPRQTLFRAEAVDRVPYMAPSLVDAARARRGKRPTDVWWHTRFPASSWVADAPAALWVRLVKAHTPPGASVLLVGWENALADLFRGLGRNVVAWPGFWNAEHLQPRRPE